MSIHRKLFIFWLFVFCSLFTAYLFSCDDHSIDPVYVSPTGIQTRVSETRVPECGPGPYTPTFVDDFFGPQVESCAEDAVRSPAAAEHVARIAPGDEMDPRLDASDRSLEFKLINGVLFVVKRSLIPSPVVLSPLMGEYPGLRGLVAFALKRQEDDEKKQ